MARFVIKNWQGDELLKRVPAILQGYGDKVAPMLQDEIKAVKYDWPTRTQDTNQPIVTRRKNGQSVTSPRNIVDTGALLNSQSAPQVAEGTMRIVWQEPYSLAVLEGNYVIGRRNGSYVARARDWITPVLEAAPREQFFAEEWRRLANAQ